MVKTSATKAAALPAIISRVCRRDRLGFTGPEQRSEPAAYRMSRAVGGSLQVRMEHASLPALTSTISPGRNAP
jgi:hypothetical protein